MIPRTCLATMYACGLRISEATTLEVGAIDRANQVLRIVGKGDKERLVPLNEASRQAMSDYLEATETRRPRETR